ncbi:MAG: ABC transporter ATP-binding protein [Oscillospiraceae bacterium]|nr:ABC transporter ATP-binding protein [Oscillospiraceae bacterium]
MEVILQVQNLDKRIRRHQILKQLSFNVARQEIVGFLGPNGAGKSTTLKCICGLYHLSGGQVTIDGHDIQRQRKAALQQLGVTIEAPALYPQLSGQDHLKMVAHWRGVSAQRQAEMAAYSGLGNALHKKVQTYSTGMRMRLMLAMTLMARPQLIILDEPTSGLDPQAIFELRQQIQAIRAAGSAVLFSSHQLDEVSKIADRIVLLNKGELIYDGKIPDALGAGATYTHYTNNNEAALAYIAASGLALEAKSAPDSAQGIKLALSAQAVLDHTLDQLLKDLSARQICIVDLVKQQSTLEDFYRFIYQKTSKEVSS